VLAGATVAIDVASAPGIAVGKVVVVGANQAAESSSAPFRVSFQIPLGALGPYEITAFGRGSDGKTYYDSEPVQVIVRTEALLERLSIPGTTFVFEKESITLFVGESAQLSVIGHFNDRVEREIPMTDVTWTSANMQVLKVDAAGMATASRTGESIVTAEARGLEASLEVVVLAEPQ
jgi:hypothetical protein